MNDLAALIARERCLGGVRIVRRASPVRANADRLEAWLGAATADQVDAIRGGVAHGAERRQDDALRVRRVHLVDNDARELAHALAAAVCEEVNVNAYWSPSGGATLAPHADGYDIAVVHLAGRKRWALPDGELKVAAGDVLVVPAHTRHVVTHDGDEPAIHFAVGIYAKTTHSLVEWLATELAQQECARVGDVQTALSELSERASAILTDPDAVRRYAAHREAMEHERMLMSVRAHEISDARRYW